MTSSRDMAASVRQRLLNRARSERRPFNELLQYYAMERFLYRLSQSVHVDRFILKGALMLRVWRSPELRPTMDIDMLGRTSNEEADIIAQIQDILAVDVETDGLAFYPASIQAERIAEDAEYNGIRIRFMGALGSARINMQIDIGFGDVVYPEPEMSDLPTMLNSTTPRLLCYSRESSIAEKLEAIVKLGVLNSRMKDFYDIWLLSRQFDFDGAKLTEAIRLTFKQRGTAIHAEIDAFAEPFIEAKQTQWVAFR
ncbi:MAG: nucleotidyl transferase AbiEii/AbiGii toxin family protein, partial [Spirochaetes bacterium]|nr:nucleotidyl transferase AbiEii/AbiGii toxin family protein [Spirochaetota bacterium]